MKDAITLSYVNMFAVLKVLEVLCETDDEAKRIVSCKPISIGLRVIGGPKATLSFGNGKCTMTQGAHGRIKLLLTSPEHFNQMVDGKKNPIPYWGFTQLKFLLKDFTRLTEILTRYLKASKQDLEDRDFFERSTKLMLHVVANALSVIGGHDELGAYSLKSIPDGVISMEIVDSAYAHIVVENGVMTTYNTRAESPRSYMIFKNYDVARGLFDGTAEAMSCLARGDMMMKGYIPMIDNLNRILSRVAVYLA
ncbi:MAG: hypothetical protein RR527_06955 [Clostridia bacterium]